MFVRIVEDGPSGAIVHDTKMSAVPRVGETLTLRMPDRKEMRYRVTEVDYLLDLKEGSSSIQEELTGARLVVQSIKA